MIGIIDQRAPDFKYLFEQEAKNRGIDFNNPDDARKIFQDLLNREDDIKGFKRYLKNVPKTKIQVIDWFVRLNSIKGNIKVLLRVLKNGSKFSMDQLIDEVRPKSKTRTDKEKAIKNLIYRTNKLFINTGEKIKIVTTEKNNRSAYMLKIDLDYFGFRIR